MNFTEREGFTELRSVVSAVTWGRIRDRRTGASVDLRSACGGSSILSSVHTWIFESAFPRRVEPRVIPTPPARPSG